MELVVLVFVDIVSVLLVPVAEVSVPVRVDNVLDVLVIEVLVAVVVVSVTEVTVIVVVVTVVSVVVVLVVVVTDVSVMVVSVTVVSVALLVVLVASDVEEEEDVVEVVVVALTQLIVGAGIHILNLLLHICPSQQVSKALSTLEPQETDFSNETPQVRHGSSAELAGGTVLTDTSSSSLHRPLRHWYPGQHDLNIFLVQTPNQLHHPVPAQDFALSPSTAHVRHAGVSIFGSL